MNGHWNPLVRRVGMSQRQSVCNEEGQYLCPCLASNHDSPFAEPSHYTHMKKVMMCWTCIFFFCSGLYLYSDAVTSWNHMASEAWMSNAEGSRSGIIWVSFLHFIRETQWNQGNHSQRQVISRPKFELGTSQIRSWSDGHFTLHSAWTFNSVVRKNKCRLFYMEASGTHTPWHRKIQVTQFQIYSILKG
jgi:hypothetical protein